MVVTVRVMLVAGLVALSGCGGGYDASDLAMPALSGAAGQARIFVERKGQFVGSTATHVVLFDGRPVANLGPGGSTDFPAPTGVHVVGLECGGKGVFGQSNQITIDLLPGRTYRIGTFDALATACQMRYAIQG